jgi:two-component system, cell cycle response regulator DivK
MLNSRAADSRGRVRRGRLPIGMGDPVRLRRPVVLIVDDHADSLAMYAFGLQAMGFESLMAETAEAAFARACELHPDVVVADVALPGISGLDLARRLREDARTSEAGIIVLTGHAGASVKEQADDAGCDRFLLKPCPPDALAGEIRDVLVRRYHRATETQ